MPQQRSRRLAVLLHADVVGSTALVQAHEWVAHERMKDAFGRLSETASRFGGTTREMRGDALLAEFPRASDAVSAAVAFQAANEERNREYGDDIRPSLRIGISLGEVVVADGTVTGVGAVLAQRLEQLASPGGVVVQGSVAETVPTRLPFSYEALGEQALKGFSQPVRAFAVYLQRGEMLPQPEPNGTAEGGHSSETTAMKPSVAVLPFEVLAADREQEHFADGLVDEVLTNLSKIASISVIARASTMGYKGQTVIPSRVAAELGVRYFVTGTVRQNGRRLRVSAQLLDSTDGGQLWGEQYDRVIEDVFDIQDEISREIVTALRVNLTDSEQALLLYRGTRNVQAWNLCVQAMELFSRFNPGDHLRARDLAKKATALDPDYALAWAILANIYWYGARSAFHEDVENSLEQAAELAEKALALDETNYFALGARMMLQLHRGDIDGCLTTGRQLVSLYPGGADARAWYALALVPCGYPEEAISMVKDAIRLNPRHASPWYEILLARALDIIGESTESLELLNKALDREPNVFMALVQRTAILAREGRGGEAARSAADLRSVNPNFRVSHVEGLLLSRDKEYVRIFSNALRQAGVPE